MRFPNLSNAASLLFCATAFTLTSVGCQDAQRYETNKPITEESAGDEMQDAADQAGDEVSETASDAADAVTPDENIVDVDSPLADVTVGRDPATGDTNVNVDTSDSEE